MTWGSIPTARDSGRRVGGVARGSSALLNPPLNLSCGGPLYLSFKHLLKHFFFLKNGSILQITSSTTKTATLKTTAWRQGHALICDWKTFLPSPRGPLLVPAAPPPSPERYGVRPVVTVKRIRCCCVGNVIHT